MAGRPSSRLKNCIPTSSCLMSDCRQLNGIETARRFRRLCPCSKILFVSQESSPVVIEEALETGAEGYVVKVRASDLLTAVDDALALQAHTI